MKKQLVFIDDSGDPGLKPGASTHFVMACAIFMSSEVAEQVAVEIREFRTKRRLPQKYEFKFHTTRKTIVEELLSIVTKYNFTISAIYLDKAKVRNILNLFDQTKLYSWAIKELLARLPLKEARIRIDGRSSKEHMQRTSTYLRKELNRNTRKILNVRFEDSSRNDLIQLADLIAGSVNRSLQKNRADAKDYLNILNKKIGSITEIKAN